MTKYSNYFHSSMKDMFGLKSKQQSLFFTFYPENMGLIAIDELRISSLHNILYYIISFDVKHGNLKLTKILQ